MEQVVNLLAGWAQRRHCTMDQDRDRQTSPVKSNIENHQNTSEIELAII